MKTENPCIIVICGPTGVGKTDLAIKVAQHFDTEIISADSRQVYKELNIGTAKPTDEQLSKITHHLISHFSIQEKFTAGDFEKVALEIAMDILKRKKIAILCGGSGLYIKAFLEGLDDLPEVPEKIKKALQHELELSGLSNLLNELRKKDPFYFEEVDKKNPHRVIRALAVIRSSGRTFSEFRSGKQKVRPFKVIKIGITRPREELNELLIQRLDSMIRNGLLEEARTLMKFKEKPSLQTVGYKEGFEYLEGKITLEESVELMKRNSRNYAKRQLTWFRKDSGITWFEPDEYNLILEHIRQRLN